MSSSNKCQANLVNLLSSFDTAMVVSRCGKTNLLHARPMKIVRIDSDLNMWFFTEMAAPKVEELNLNNNLCATLQSNDKWISLSGSAIANNDHSLKKELWNTLDGSFKQWFGGKKLDELTLLELKSCWAEYWDVINMSKPVQLEVCKAGQSGTATNLNSHHAKLNIRSDTPTSLSAQ